MLTVPMVNQRDDVIGVIQLINKKRNPKERLREPADFEAQVVPFDKRSEELAMTQERNRLGWTSQGEWYSISGPKQPPVPQWRPSLLR